MSEFEELEAGVVEHHTQLGEGRAHTETLDSRQSLQSLSDSFEELQQRYKQLKDDSARKLKVHLLIRNSVIHAYVEISGSVRTFIDVIILHNISTVFISSSVHVHVHMYNVYVYMYSWQPSIFYVLLMLLSSHNIMHMHCRTTIVFCV